MQDKLMDTVVCMDPDVDQTEMTPLRNELHQVDNASCRSSSILSCSSVGASKSHSRQNSGDSLLDVFDGRPSSLTRNATSSELLDVKPLTLIRKSSAPALGYVMAKYFIIDENHLKWSAPAFYRC